ncbi:hypothetical protein C8J57DRAFT_180297 [Mycena rebaudengoi]|nr:hypothetical protein C8J57DRAFT_180297 [Mycena rebaudengoi]
MRVTIMTFQRANIGKGSRFSFSRHFNGWAYQKSYNEAWLAQANHIFDCAQIRSKHSDYGVIDSVVYWLRLSNTNCIPPGYLFLCPLQDLQGNSPSEFRYPACPAYWSLDPSGAQRLGSDEAARLGFPSVTVSMIFTICSWDDHVYTGIREYHQAKGFDPYSQDVARELGYPLFEVRGKTGILSRVPTLWFPLMWLRS